MKVALVITDYSPQGGGAASWTDRHARMLLDSGHEVHLLAATIKGAPAGAVHHLLDGMSGAGNVAKRTFADRAGSLLESLDLDIVHDMGQGWCADIFMPHHGTRRAVYDQRSKLLIPPERWLRPVAFHCLPRYLRFKMRERRQYRVTTEKLFVAVSDMVRRQMILYHKIPHDRIRLVYNGVDVDRFRPAHSSELIHARRRLRSELGFTDEVVYLIVSHDFDLKGLWVVMRSLRAMLADGHKAALMVVGPGAMTGKKIWGVPIGRAIDRYPRLARRWGCDRAVRFVGLQDNAVPFFQAADVYVQPTLYDACSLVVLEAMSCGLPVITSQYNGVSELIHNDVEGYVVDDPQDVQCVTQRMCVYLDASRRRAAGLAARWLAEHHSAMINFNQIMAAYQDVLARRAAVTPERPRRAAVGLTT